MIGKDYSQINNYAGGQMTVENRVEEYSYVGQIRNIRVERNELLVNFDWLVRDERYPNYPPRWVRDDKRDYGCSLEIYFPSGLADGRGVFYLKSPYTNESIVIYPRDWQSKPLKLEDVVD